MSELESAPGAVTTDVRRLGAPQPWKVWGWAARVTLILALIGAWQLYGSAGSNFAIPAFTEVLEAFWEGISSGDFLVAAMGTLVTMALGYGIAVSIAVPMGVWIGSSRFARNVFEPLVHAAYATPVSLFIPIIGIYTGLELSGRVALTALWCVFEIMVSTVSGVRSTPVTLIEMSRAYGAKRSKIYSSIVIPAALPLVVVGLRIGVGRAMRGAVTAELLLSAANLGQVVLFAGSVLDIPRLLAAIVFVMLLGLVLMRIAGVIERRATSHLHL
ncbi:Riboflavin transport system permease protein RibX [Mycolicibacterium vanbaalenii]|uniref:Riboflavin transport system permease protein RibX n=1 Tax=Mycolicibacterium vanbaalenii TaxID=110539 RepID=A0A5S9R4T0_MYCVN|nr:ABC transporter permease [Mycolicibacterium vanbaalenii]CAA0128100.1 Riboflavin transport system permease protein RibX [Mycolicibacterium vanbaalenii]